ncbi:hypothetical protein [Mucilaginibacter phyllosphaerae]|uniref:Uncharacterized protein n=1 Tax=Mucilaginibacter phyllosphaerae TaxID=1812349 RepID=A0A4Y8AD97_9SPHI|nr:hypothetical protein [Mucilaginibacter phyllosphaerae]MBB3969295.1 hypothetical protein [Mucilaginibacter phyllosphaerae]TEW65908.1 hypothetical protein E2R65_12300 [Mucilaginibacter phyllosphaerae]GGH07504.1 hypothetical protein GCM10007352_12300 [Mucilaginibacter phyllosphaerae]
MSRESDMAKNGYKQSSNDANKYVNGSSSVTIRPGNGIIIDNGGRHNSYGNSMSNTDFNNRIKK